MSRTASALPPPPATGPTLHPAAQLVALSDRLALVEHPNGGALIESNTAALFAILGALDGAPLSQSLASLPPALQRFAPRLIEQLGPDICTTEAPPARSLRVAVVGNGPWASRVQARLDEVFPGSSALHIFPAGEGESARRLPPGRLGSWSPPAAQLQALFADNDLVIVAPERVAWAALRPFHREALRSPRGALLPALPERGGISLGPLIEAGRAGCWFCHRLKHLGATAESLGELSRACDQLAFTSLADCAPLAQERALAGLTEEVMSLAEQRVPATIGDVIAFPPRGKPQSTPVRPLAACPECSSLAAERRHAAAFRWREAFLSLPGALVAAPPVPWGRAERHDRLRGWLLALGEAHAAQTPHAITTFLAHLQGTWDILDGWGQPEELCCAGLFHSVYGSESFDRPTFSGDERATLQRVLGVEVERLIFLFCTLDRARFLDTVEPLGALPDEGLPAWNWRTGEEFLLSAEDAARLLVIELANLAEQSHQGDFSPGLWLAAGATWARVLARRGVVLPPFRSPTVTLTARQEDQARRAYLISIEQQAIEPRLAEAAALEATRLNPFVGEPWLVAASLCRDRSEARTRASEGLHRLHRWLTPWDKRASFGAWLAWGQSILDSE